MNWPEADKLRAAICEGRFPPAPTKPTPTTPADLTFGTFAEKWRTIARAAMPATLRANDAAICQCLGELAIDDAPLSTRPLGLITEDVIEAAFGQLARLAGSTWNKYRDVIRMMQRWGVKKGYLPRPWLSDDNEIVVHKETAKRDRRLMPDVLDSKGTVVTPGEERRLLSASDGLVAAGDHRRVNGHPNLPRRGHPNLPTPRPW